jgi:prepilin-type N-terminal cleavage/methylation domain-containing protein
MKQPCRVPGQGFTLVELIVTLVIAAVVASALVSFIGNAITRSHLPLQWFGEAYSLHATMENIASGRTNALTVLSAQVGAEGTRQDNAFGAYNVVHNRFIEFDAASNERSPAATNTVLKITIRGQSGETLTRLFSGGATGS